jgi:tetratricopeptide (TPR) repeat protein
MSDAKALHAFHASSNRSRGRAPALLSWLVVGLMAWAVRDASAQVPGRCVSVQPGGDIHFRQQTLRDAPDIDSPEIRRINALVSLGCFDEAKTAVQLFVLAHPGDYKIRFVQARMSWIEDGDKAGREAMRNLVQDHPNFASAKALLASLYLDAGEMDQASKLLDEVAATSPNDLRLFMSRLKLAAQDKRNADTVKNFAEVLNNAEFPPWAREGSAMQIAQLPGASPSDKEAAYRAQMNFESATPWYLKAYNLAFFLYDEDQTRRPAELIGLIKQLQADPASKPKAVSMNFMLSVAYLRQAEAIDPKPSYKNADLIRLATQATDPSLLRVPLQQVPYFADLVKLLAVPTEQSADSK